MVRGLTPTVLLLFLTHAHAYTHKLIKAFTNHQRMSLLSGARS